MNAEGTNVIKMGMPPERLKEIKKRSDVLAWVIIIALIMLIVLVLLMNNRA